MCRLRIVRDVLSWSHSSIEVSSLGLNASFVSADFGGNEMDSIDTHALTFLSTSGCVVHLSRHI